jgi:cytochrome c oxidase cbb3-type subunit 3
VGPNLTDEYYKNVRQVEDIAKVIIKGAGNGAMPAWANRLNENEIVLVSAYVASLRGQNVPGKNPDGVEIAPWPEPAAESESEAPESGDSTAST